MAAVHPDDRDRAQRVMEEAIRSGEKQEADLRIVRPDLTERVVYVVSEVVPDEAGAPVILVGTAQDVTERVAAERALEESEAQLVQAQQVARFGSWDWNVVTGELRWSDEVYRLLGIPVGGVVPAFDLFIDAVHPDDRPGVQRSIDQALSSGGPFETEFRVVHPDDTERMLHARGDVTLDETGEPARLVGTVQDVTDRVAAERALRESEGRFRSVFETAQNGIILVGIDGRPQLANGALCRMLGYSQDEILKLRWEEVLNPAAVERVQRRGEAIVQGDLSPQEGVFELRHKDGALIDVEASTSVMRDGDAVSCVLIEVRDITGRLRAERAIRESEARIRAVMETVQNGIVLLDRDGRAVLFNDALCRMLGYTREEMEGMPLAHVLRPQDREAIYQRIAARTRGEDVPDRYHLKMVRKGGETIDAEIFASPFIEDGETIGSLAELRDITEELALQRSVEQTAAEVTSILEAAPNAIILADDQGGILRVNPAVCELFGWDEDELLSLNVRDLTPEPLRSRHDGYLRHYLETGEPSTPEGLIVGRIREVEGRRKDGTTFPLELSIAELGDADTGRRFTAVMRDISDRKQAERDHELAQRATVRSQFLATMSHELRTPLNSILGFGQLLEESKREPLTGRQRSRVSDIMESGEHLLALINDVLDLSKVDAGRYELSPAPLDPAALVTEVARGFEPMARDAELELRVSVEAAPEHMVADRRAFRQVLTNLISNAIKFTEEGYVEVRASEAEGHLIIEVEDTGIGIAREQLGRVFEEFSQLDSGASRRSGGTGLGLAITRRLVELQGGTCSVESEVGRGSTFTVRLPVGPPAPTGTSDPESRSTERAG
ncbi:MAG: PAS domain S-box protein [Chloroflexi bacterium]|nr:PAS domain S-box protein [Chloroflexota bacterium]